MAIREYPAAGVGHGSGVLRSSSYTCWSLYIRFTSAPLGFDRAGLCNEYSGLSLRFRDVGMARSLRFANCQ